MKLIYKLLRKNAPETAEHGRESVSVSGFNICVRIYLITYLAKTIYAEALSIFIVAIYCCLVRWCGQLKDSFVRIENQLCFGLQRKLYRCVT